MSMATVKTNDSFNHWWDPEGRKTIINHRRALRASTKNYLEKVPLIEGAPADFASTYPIPVHHAQTYVRLVRGELAQHGGDKSEALWTGLLFGPLFAQMWSVASSINLSALTVPQGVNAFRGVGSHAEGDAIDLLRQASQIPLYEIEDWIAAETLETAEMLAQAHIKAFVEFATVCSRPQDDAMVIRHHSSMLAENMSDMLQLVVQGGEPTDLRLPDNHLHKVIAKRQMVLRAESASTLRNVSLGRS